MTGDRTGGCARPPGKYTVLRESMEAGLTVVQVAQEN